MAQQRPKPCAASLHHYNPSPPDASPTDSPQDLSYHVPSNSEKGARAYLLKGINGWFEKHQMSALVSGFCLSALPRGAETPYDGEGADGRCPCSLVIWYI